MHTQLSGFPELEADKIVNYYLDKMTSFMEMIRDDMTHKPSEQQFKRDLRDFPDGDFSIKCDFEIRLPKPVAERPTHTATEISCYLSALYQLPYTRQPLNRLVGQPASVSTPVHILVNDSKGYHAPLYASVHTTEHGSILPLCQFITESAMLEKPGNVAVLLDAGRGTRSTLLGIQAGSKGLIEMGGRRLNEYTSDLVQTIADSLGKSLSNDLVIIGSCDDLFEHDMTFINNVIEYFKLQPSPGIFWTDLPASGKQHMPMTTADTVAFMNSHFVRDKVNHFFECIPFTEGYAKADVVTKTMDGLMHLYNHYQQWTPPAAGVNPAGRLTLPGLSEAAARYTQLLQWYGMSSKESGLKKPFLMIMKKTFMRDFIKEVAAIIPEYTKTHITWENILLRGMKADRQVWNMLGKPAQVSTKKWNKIYDAIQQLRIQHHIDTKDEKQNTYRARPPVWQSLDDPYAIMTTIERIYRKNPNHRHRQDACQLISDLPLTVTELPQLIADRSMSIIAMSSHLAGTISPTHPTGVLVSHKTTEKVLLAGITIAKGQHLSPIPGHVVVDIRGEIYSTSLMPVNKKNLQHQPIFHYHRETGLLDPAPVAKNAAKFREILRKTAQSLTPSFHS